MIFIEIEIEITQRKIISADTSRDCGNISSAHLLRLTEKQPKKVDVIRD